MDLSHMKKKTTIIDIHNKDDNKYCVVNVIMAYT